MGDKTKYIYSGHTMWSFAELFNIPDWDCPDTVKALDAGKE